VIDSVDELDRGFLDRIRAPDYFAALAHYLQGKNITGYLTLDIPKIIGQELDLTNSPLAMLAENLALLRYMEYRGRVQRLLSILKMRSSAHDHVIRTFEIADGIGLRLMGEAPTAQGLLTGIVRDGDNLPVRTRRRRSQGGPLS
jgi:circadian clock protein KaiC